MPERENIKDGRRCCFWAMDFGKTIGIVSLGRIGTEITHMASQGFGSKVIYYRHKKKEDFEKNFPAVPLSLSRALMKF